MSCVCCRGHSGIVLPTMPETLKPETSKTPTFRSACITHFGEPYDELPDKMQYLAYGKEVCPTTGREHYQMWAYAKTPMRLPGWKKIFVGDHIEMMRGTFAENDKYCSKESELVTFGLRPMENGKKRTVAEVITSIESGERYSKIRRKPEVSETCARFNRFFKEIEQDVRLEQSRAVGFKKKTVHVYIGAAGCHKTRHVHEQFPDVYTMPDNSMQWAGSYDGESAVLFDDVGPGDIMSITRFLRYCDGYPIEVPIKGGYRPWVPDHIFFTSNCHPRLWWKDLDALQLQAVERRLDVIRVYKAPGEYDEYGAGQT